MSSLDQIGYLLLKLKTILSVVPIVSIKLAILIFISLIGAGLDFFRALHKLLIFYFHEHLGYGSIERS